MVEVVDTEDLKSSGCKTVPVRVRLAVFNKFNKHSFKKDLKNMSDISDIVSRNPVINSDRFDLVGVDGNAFSIIGHVKQAMRYHKWSSSDIAAVTTLMMSSDYDNLLSVASSVIYSQSSDDDYDDDSCYDDDCV